MSLSMNQMCRNAYYKSKEREYRELTSKQYEEIDSLESDITDKEKFLQKVVQARNKFQEDVANLEKKIFHLAKEKVDLLDKIEQLGEDTDTGVELLKNAQEREYKLKRILEDHPP